MGKFMVVYSYAYNGIVGRDVVETTKHGVSLKEANDIAEESNRRYAPLTYMVTEHNHA